MQFVPLDRRFNRWAEEDRTDVETLRLLGLGRFGLGWDEVLEAKRTVVLAEGGSGKSAEFQSQHERLARRGEFSFIATVAKVGRQGFESVLTRQDRGRLEKWRESEKTAWFFVDSVDEAKLALVSFEDALHHIADCIYGAEGRARVIISGRHADWEFKRDLSFLAKMLPIHDLAAAPLATPNELVVQAIHRQKVAPSPEERPLVLLMSPLNEEQVEKFAIGRNIPNAKAFLADIEKSRLWRFASRPADLDWLVEYWTKNRAFSDLKPMLDLNLQARFMETSRQRAGQMTLDSNSAMRAIDRIGAALVFGRQRDILIPDSDRTPGDDSKALSLVPALPDLTQRQHLDLINSALFVPAEPGLVRLHNDNEGAVRSYLAARWLQRLADNHCPWSRRLELLFATTYGVDVVKPSMKDTAAWLAIGDESIAQEILARDPMLLLELGDPASLPAHIRVKALAAAIETWAARPHLGFVTHDSLRRFAKPDLDEPTREHWLKWKDREAIRHLLLMLIEAGRLSGCADIALSAATDLSFDALSQSLAVRALAAIGGPESFRTYRDFLLANRASLAHDMLWVAVNDLFPSALSVEDLILLMGDLTRKESAHSSGIDFYGPHLVERIHEPGPALALLRHMMAITLTDADDTASLDFELVEARANTMRALALRILDLDEPSLPREIFDLQLWLDHVALSHGFNRLAKFDVGDRLSKEARLRQAWFWTAVEKYAALPKAATNPLERVWQLSEFGYYPRFDESDAPWLLADMSARPSQSDKTLALDALLRVWRSHGQSDGLLQRISDAAKGTPGIEAQLHSWLQPVETSNPMSGLTEQQRARLDAAERQRAEAERSWAERADNIRANPQQLKDFFAPRAGGNDQIVFLWNILRGRSEDVSIGAAPDLGAMKGLFDDDVIELFRTGLISRWRSAPTPTLKVNAPVEMRNTFTFTEMMGVDGIALEALADPRWAEKLLGDEPSKAAIYATFALNRLPRWLPDLCAAHPMACAEVLRQHLAWDMGDTTGSQRRDNLERMSDSDAGVAKVLQQDMWEFIERNSGNPSLALAVVSPTLKILRGDTQQRSRLFSLAIARAEQMAGPSHAEPSLVAEYLATAFFIDADTAIEALIRISNNLAAEPAQALATALIPKLFGNSWTPPEERINKLSVENLERLILFAFDRIPPSKDVDRANGKVYSPDERDFATGAREIAFNRLANMPGAAAYAALRRFIARTDFPYPTWHLEELARKRCEIDSESSPWEPSDIVAFESDFQALPRTPSDLQRLAANRFADLEHHMIHSDFGQGDTFALLPYEVDVQRWLADHFRKGQGVGFSIEREPHSADEKEPDLRIEAKATDARLPIEIKVAGSWSRTKLEEALEVQLMGRYLRDEKTRWGILLLVYQAERAEGWEKPFGSGHWTFAEVVEHLRARARDIAAKDSSAPQMRVCVIDVSKVPRKPPKKTD